MCACTAVLDQLRSTYICMYPIYPVIVLSDLKQRSLVLCRGSFHSSQVTINTNLLAELIVEAYVPISN